MSSSTGTSSSSSTPTYQVFEVYNVGCQPLDALKYKNIAEIRSQYTLLSPIESAEQLKPNVALATLPKEGLSLRKHLCFMREIVKGGSCCRTYDR